MPLFLLNLKSTKARSPSRACYRGAVPLPAEVSGHKGRGSAYSDLIVILFYASILAHESVIRPPATPLGSSWIGNYTFSARLTLVLVVATSLGPVQPDSTVPQLYHFSLAFYLVASLTPQCGTLEKGQHSQCANQVAQRLGTLGQPLTKRRGEPWINATLSIPSESQSAAVKLGKYACVGFPSFCFSLQHPLLSLGSVPSINYLSASPCLGLCFLGDPRLSHTSA